MIVTQEFVFIKASNDCLVHNRLKELAHDTDKANWRVLRGRTSITSVVSFVFIDPNGGAFVSVCLFLTTSVVLFVYMPRQCESSLPLISR